MRRVVALGLGLALSCALSASAQSVGQLLEQGRWLDAANQAERQKDYALAALALDRLMECPSPEHPKGQVWDTKIGTRAVELTLNAIASAKTAQDERDSQLQHGTHVGHLAGLSQNVSSLTNTISMARASKKAFEKAVTTDPNDLEAAATYAFYLARSFSRGGLILGISRADALKWIGTSARLFNQAPDATEAQQRSKAVGALRLGEAYESLNDRKLMPYFEAAIKLGEQAGGAEGRCIANVARVHLNQPVTQF